MAELRGRLARDAGGLPPNRSGEAGPRATEARRMRHLFPLRTGVETGEVARHLGRASLMRGARGRLRQAEQPGGEWFSRLVKG